jgi:hypothetical protein
MSRVLTQRQLNRAMLARQLLLERGRGGISKTLERIGGIQAQYAPSMYVGLWTRLEGFERDQLDRALEKRTVAQGTLMRITIHLVSAKDWWPFSLALRDARRQWVVKARKQDPDVVAAAAARLRRLMAGEPMQASEIRKQLGDALGHNAPLWLDMVRVPPSGTWRRRRADLYGLADHWLGSPPSELDTAAAVDQLVLACLRGFGPMRAADIVSISGLRAADVTESLSRLELRRFLDEDRKELVDLPRAPLPDPDIPAPVRFLPVWDSTLLLANIRRTGIFRERHRRFLDHHDYPQGTAVFLVDGVAAGAWRFEKGRLDLRPFERLDRATMRELREESERLAQLHH